jgi:hypothetical protein
VRARIALFAVFLAIFGAESAWSQQKSKTTAKRKGGQALPQGSAPVIAPPDAVRDREQAIYKEWAKMIRETMDAAKQMARNSFLAAIVSSAASSAGAAEPDRRGSVADRRLVARRRSRPPRDDGRGIFAGRRPRPSYQSQARHHDAGHISRGHLICDKPSPDGAAFHGAMMFAIGTPEVRTRPLRTDAELTSQNRLRL